MIYLLTAIGLSPGGSSTVHNYTQTVHRTTQNKQYTEQHYNFGECGPCPVLARFTLAYGKLCLVTLTLEVHRLSVAHLYMKTSVNFNNLVK